MRFVIDAQLPPALARQLRSSGHEASHVYEIGLGAAADSEVWAHASTVGAVLVTKDEDFAHLVRRETAEAAVVWIRLGNTTNRALWEALEPLCPDLIDALRRGERLIEIAEANLSRQRG